MKSNLINAGKSNIRVSLLRRSTGVYRISRRTIRNFTMDLSVMICAKVSLMEALDILSDQTDSKKMAGLLSDIMYDLQNGFSLTSCLSQYRSLFGGLYINLIRVGEMTGRLDEMLMQISAYLSKVSELKKKFLQALTYPALVLSVAFASVSFLLLYIVPTFKTMFQDLDADLPQITKVIFLFSNFCSDQAWYLFFFSLFLLISGYRLFTITTFRVSLMKLMLKMPFIGSLLTKYHISHFCRTLGILLESGIPLLQSLDATLQTSDHNLLLEDIHRMKASVIDGQKIGGSLVNTIFFPPMVSRMICVGEETAHLPQMLVRISDHYDRELDSLMESLSVLIEPLVIIILGLIIGTVIIGIYLPLFNMTELIGI